MLEHAQTWAGKLKQPKDSLVNVVGEAAVLRATLWQYLREQADAGQLKAIEDGRAAGVPWHHFTEALCVTSKQGAYQKARRLKAEQVRDPGERRAPENAREHEDRVAAEQRAERTLMLVQERRFPVARQIGRLLLEHRDGIVLDSWATYWLGEIAETIDDRDDPAERARFTGRVESFVRAVHGHARQQSALQTVSGGGALGSDRSDRQKSALRTMTAVPYTASDSSSSYVPRQLTPRSATKQPHRDKTLFERVFAARLPPVDQRRAGSGTPFFARM